MNAEGKIVEPDIDNVTGYSEGFLVCAKPFACDIQVRSEKKRETIVREYETAEREVFSKYQYGE
jgi:cytochrome P450 family 619